MNNGKLLYPTLGVGSFCILFLFGACVGHSLGLHLVTILAVGLISGCAGTKLVTQLERRESGF